MSTVSNEPTPPPAPRSKGKAAAPAGSGALSNEQGHLTVGSDNYEASHYFGDASSLYLAVGDQPGIEGSSSGWFRPGWLESHLHFGGSAWQQNRDMAQLSQQLPDRERMMQLADVYFEVCSPLSTYTDGVGSVVGHLDTR
jgi:hypothetical protein